MPTRHHLPWRRPKRLFALLCACGTLGIGALAVPTSAGAYTDHFCQYVFLPSGANCYASNPHTLQTVNGWSVNSFQRVCAASFTGPYGWQTSDWRCDYGFTQKLLWGRVSGVGGVHNGDPSAMYGYGTQDF